jgi:hypothetical protein
MQFKKLAAITGSALMAGLSLAVPVLATSVTALKDINKLVGVTDSTVSFPMFVIGATAATSDVAGAVDVAVNLASNAKTTKQVTVSGAGESVTGGVKIRTVGAEFTPWTNIRSVKTVLTGSEVDFLKGGTFYLSTGSSGAFKEYLYLGGNDSSAASTQPQIKYDTATGETSPSLYLYLPSNKQIYEYLLTFSTSLTLGTTDATAQTALIGSTIKMLGKDFAISDATSTSTAISSITMLGGGSPLSVETGGSKTMTFGGKDYTVTLTSVAAETVSGSTYYSAIGDVNGESFQLRAAQTKTLSDGTSIGATKVFAPIVAGQSGYATFTLGGAKYVLGNNSATVTKDGVSITGLTSIITSTNYRLSSIALYYAPNTEGFVKEGNKFTDVFANAFDLKFNSFTPEFDDTTNRQTIQYTSSGPNVRLSYTNAGGETESLDIFYNSGGTMLPGRTSTIDVVTDEYFNITSSDGDYFLVSSGGFSHLLQFTSIDTSNSILTFTDVGTGQSSTVTYSAPSTGVNASLIMDGFSYGVHIVSATDKKIQVDLNRDSDIAGTAYASLAANGQTGYQGADFSFFVPKLITTGQGGLHVYNITWSNCTTGITAAYLPNGVASIQCGQSAANLDGWANYTDSTGTAASVTLTAASINDTTVAAPYNFTTITSSTYGDFRIQCYDDAGTGVTVRPICRAVLFDGTNYQTSPGFVLVQEALQGTTTHNWLFVPVTYSSTLVKAGIGTPVSDDGYYTNATKTIGGTTSSRGMTQYGTYIEYDASSSLSATLKYPDSFSYSNIYVLGPTGTISTTGTAGAVTTETVLPITADVVKLDSEVSDTDKTGKDLVLVGGPCINTLVADLATANKFPYTCANWPGRNFGKIQLISDAFATGKTALVIAGTRAAETDLAARIVQSATAANPNFPGATATQMAGASVEVTGTVSSPAYS